MCMDTKKEVKVTKEVQLIKVDAVLMPSGEIISNGCHIGWLKGMQKMVRLTFAEKENLTNTD